MAYHFRLEQFEGPLDLLLALIEKEKLDITRVSLAQVADQYLEHIRTDEAVSLQNLASFLSIAARLILIKSRALLPILDWQDDEEEAMEDLEARLKEYRRYREASVKLGALFVVARPAYGRESFLGAQALYYPPDGISASDLRSAFAGVIGEIPVLEILPEREIRAVVSLEEKILHLQTVLSDRIGASFAELIGNVQERVEVIVSFLALLELVKQRFIRVEQTQYFSDIRIERVL